LIELKIALQPKQKAFLRAVEGTPVTFYGGAKGGGKSKGVRDIMLLRRFQYAGTHGGLFRRTYKELEGNHIRPLFKERPALKEFWNESKKLLILPNGSTLEFCHCENEKDVDLYQGREFEDLAIEEAGQWTEQMFRTLYGSNRSATPGFKPRTLLTGNPGGIGHAWLKRIFIERRFKLSERPEDYAFVQALVDDNVALLENDPDYVHKLESEPNEALRRAFRHGDWDIFAGQFFGEIDRNIHLIDPFPIPDHWSREGAYDYGFNHPAAFGWFAGDGDGNVYMYREFVKAQLRVDQFIQELLKHDDTIALQKIPAGLDCWAKKSNTINKQQGPNPPTIAEEFAANGLYLRRANVDRIQGANQVRKYLSWRNKPSGINKPKLFIFKTCPITLDCLTRMQVDPDRQEDVLKIDASDGDVNTGDDPYDMIRYYLMSRPLLADDPPGPKPGTPEYEKQFSETLFRHTQEKIQKEREIRDGQGINWDLDQSGAPSWNQW
jgi:phage terminase large subunit